MIMLADGAMLPDYYQNNPDTTVHVYGSPTVPDTRATGQRLIVYAIIALVALAIWRAR